MKRIDSLVCGSRIKRKHLFEWAAHFQGQDVHGGIPAESLPGSAVAQSVNIVELSLADSGLIRALGQERAQSTVAGLVAGARPVPVGIRKPDVAVMALGEFSVTGHVAAAVIGQALTERGRQRALRWRAQSCRACAAHDSRPSGTA